MRCRILLPLFLLILFAAGLQGQTLSYTPESDSMIAAGINYAHNLQLDSAITTFDRLIDLYPDHPMGYFYKAGIYDLFNQDYRVTTYEEEYERAIDLAIKKGEKYVDHHKDDVLGYFYLGGAYGFRGLHRVYKREWLHVFIDGYKGLKNLQKSLEKRPDFYDTYFGLGLYHYWRSAMTKKLRFLPFISDERQRGINELKLSIEKGHYVGVEARVALASIYYNERKYDSSLVINDWLYKRFPFDPSVLYLRTRIYERKQDWQMMLDTAAKLIDILNAYPYKSIGYLVEWNYLMAKAKYHLNQKNAAYQHLETAIELEKSRDKKKELEGPNEDFDEIFKNVKELRKQIQQEQQ